MRIKKVHIGLTGHRPNKLDGYNINKESYKSLQKDLEIFITHHLTIYETVICHSGLALGGDTVWSKAILNVRKRHPKRVKFYAEIPMPDQASVWFDKDDINFWYKQVNESDRQNVYGSLRGLGPNDRKYKAIELLDKRNKGMIDQLDILLTLWDGSKSGTYNAIEYAKDKNIKIYHIKLENYFK